jgi:hypothetical protein
VRRLHLLEIHDQAWFPAFLRDHVTDALQLLLNLPRVYRPIVPRLRAALNKTVSPRILDLCSGAGGPWSWLLGAIESNGGAPIQLVLSDKYPNTAAFERARFRSSGHVRIHLDPVDVTHVPPRLTGFRTLFTSFHHFRPQDARSILQDTANHRQGIGIFEAPGRHLVTLFLIFLIPVGNILTIPFMRPFRWSRLFWTYVLPVVPFVLFVDGIVSCLRVYSPAELNELVAAIDAPGYSWEIGVERGGLLQVPITYLVGYPSTVTPLESSLLE